MVRITNGKEVYEVTKGAYENSFRKLGYELVEEKVDEGTTKPSSGEEIGNEKSDDEKFVDEMLTTPLSNWRKDNVKRFANIKGIDISGTKNIDEARKVISEALNS